MLRLGSLTGVTESYSCYVMQLVKGPRVSQIVKGTRVSLVKGPRVSRVFSPPLEKKNPARK
jgi:hypothetical protein